AVDGTSNCYITGYFKGTADFDPGIETVNLTSVGNEDIFFAKYDANGNYLWAKSIGGTSSNHGSSIAIDGTGNCYITGYFRGTTDFDPGAGTANLTPVDSSDIFFARYDVNGNYLWAKSIGSTSMDFGISIAVDSIGNCYITGFFRVTTDFDPGTGTVNLTSIGNWDIFFAKYDANGNYLWAKNIGSSYGDGGYSIAVDDTGNIYLTGYFQSTADFNPGAGTANLTSVGYKDIFFAKYGQSAMGINENIIVESINIYPNPANNNIVFEGLQEGKIELINLQGQVIRNIEITETKTSIDLSKLSSGIYLIKLSTGKSIITKKFVKQ
ncbi:MAG: T9SS type A sorting domain-containing protein, partial [Bacteroidia bacterium]|nr:T9SS type A sorting domain-containing protein [Bacteroidia bacterium]